MRVDFVVGDVEMRLFVVIVGSAAGPAGWGETRTCTSAYGYTARTLEHYVRRTGFFTLAEAVRRLTSLPAAQLGLRDRGAVAIGNFADLVVFDPAGIHDRSSPDDMARHPTGLDYVMVNGRVALGPGGAADARHGRLLQP